MHLVKGNIFIVNFVNQLKVEDIVLTAINGVFVFTVKGKHLFMMDSDLTIEEYKEILQWQNIKPCTFCGGDNVKLAWHNPKLTLLDLEDVFYMKIAKKITVCTKCYYSGLFNHIYGMDELKKYVSRSAKKRINIVEKRISGNLTVLN